MSPSGQRPAITSGVRDVHHGWIGIEEGLSFDRENYYLPTSSSNYYIKYVVAIAAADTRTVMFGCLVGNLDKSMSKSAFYSNITKEAYEK